MGKAINPIKNGTVIDHIPKNKGRVVWDMLNLPQSEEKEVLGVKLSSEKLNGKDLLMFENLELSSKQLNTIALIAPNATVNIIKNGQVITKKSVNLPDSVEGFIICPNPKCITNQENVDTKFHVEQNGDVEVKCYYCERKYGIGEVKIKM
jgi:aspartate carbamoyltransferase regulatory subunit